MRCTVVRWVVRISSYNVNTELGLQRGLQREVDMWANLDMEPKYNWDSVMHSHGGMYDLWVLQECGM